MKLQSSCAPNPNMSHRVTTAMTPLQEGEGVIDDSRLLDELLELRLVVLQLAGHLGKKSMQEKMTDRLLPHFISVAVVENFCLTFIGLTKKVLLML